MCVEKCAHTCFYCTKLIWAFAMIRVPKLGWHAWDIFCGTVFVIVNMCTCIYVERLLQAQRGPSRTGWSLLLEWEMIKTFSLPMIVIRGKTTLTIQAISAGFSCSDSDFLSSYSVQTVQGSACFNALMTWTVSRGQINRQTDSWGLSYMSV